MIIDIANEDTLFVIKGNYCIYTQTDSMRGICTIISDHRIDFKDLVTDVVLLLPQGSLVTIPIKSLSKMCPIHSLTNTAINPTWLNNY